MILDDDLYTFFACPWYQIVVASDDDLKHILWQFSGTA